MSFVKLSPPAAGVTGTGISLSLSVPKNSPAKVRLSITEWKQKELWGDTVEGQRFTIKIGTDKQEGQMLIDKDPQGEFIAKAGVKNGVTIWIAHWASLPLAPRKGACEVYSKDAGGVVLKLPSWCRPHGAGGKLSAPQSTLASGV